MTLTKVKNPKLKIKYSKISWIWIPQFYKNKLIWKENLGVPECTQMPSYHFKWLLIHVSFTLGCKQYWEQRIWLAEYSNDDYQEAVSTWPWIDNKTFKSTWKNHLLKG